MEENPYKAPQQPPIDQPIERSRLGDRFLLMLVAAVIYVIVLVGGVALTDLWTY